MDDLPFDRKRSLFSIWASMSVLPFFLLVPVDLFNPVLDCERLVFDRDIFVLDRDGGIPDNCAIDSELLPSSGFSDSFMADFNSALTLLTGDLPYLVVSAERRPVLYFYIAAVFD